MNNRNEDILITFTLLAFGVALLAVIGVSLKHLDISRGNWKSDLFLFLSAYVLFFSMTPAHKAIKKIIRKVKKRKPISSSNNERTP